MRRLAKIAPDALPVSIRWNPGEGAGFNPAVITAGAESHGRPIKFGIEEDRILELCSEALSLGLKPVGLHQHIGSGWTGDDVDHFLETVDSTLQLASQMADALGYPLEQLDLGGGPGIPYKPGQQEFPVDRYGEGIFSCIKDSNIKFKRLCIESGRYIVGDAGVLLTRVNTVEKKYGNLLVGVDAGFNTLVRPAFYGIYEGDQFHETYHHIVIVERVTGPQAECTIAGPLCETGDLLAVKREMTKPEEGETLAILGAGAYGYSMASIYNFQPRPPEVILPGCIQAVRRETYTDLVHLHGDKTTQDV
jgi:diaminopimelate decarboxylase